MGALVLVLLTSQGCGGPTEQLMVGQETWAVHTVCGGSTTLEGIDVSKWNETVDWQAVKGDGIVYAFARVSDGLNYPDAYFAGNWTGMKQAGIIRGVYQYFRPSQDAADQANYLIQQVQQNGGLDPGDLPPVLDLETAEGMSSNAILAQVDIWLDTVKQALNRKPIIYTGSYFWDDNIVSSAYADYPLWIPHYTSKACPLVPISWQQWTFWQYSDSGSVDGVNGNVDVNRYNGTLAELQAFIAWSGGQSTTPPPPPPPPPPDPSEGAPQGHLEAVSCQGIVGWAQDPDVPTGTVQVRVYIDIRPDQGDPVLVTVADKDRPDLCDMLGTCNHGFRVAIPAMYMDGNPHLVRVVAVDYNGENHALLSGGPMSFTCGGNSSGGPGSPSEEEPSAPSTPDDPSTETPYTWSEDDPSNQERIFQDSGCSLGGAARGSSCGLWSLLALALGLMQLRRRK